MNRTLTLHELEVFLLLAETCNFRLAAERIHLSQPALSRTLQSAEWKLSARLFDRNTRKVELSSAGQELLPIATRVLSEFRHSLSDLSEFVAGRRGHFAVASLPSAAAELLPPAIAAFRETHPQVTIDIQPFPAEKLLSMVKEGSADFALSIPPGVDREINYESLIRDEFVLICKSDHPLALLPETTWEVFGQYPFIASGSVTSVRHITDSVLGKIDQTIAPVYESSNLALLGAMVAANLGISAIPKLTLRLIGTPGLATVPLKSPTVNREIGILTRYGRSLSTATTLFIEQLRIQAHQVATK